MGQATMQDIHHHRQFIALSYPLLGLIGALSALAGLGQAALLLLIVRIATALTAQTEEIGGTVGPISAQSLSTPHLLWIALAVLGAVLLVELAAAALQARVYARSQRTTQRNLLRCYSRTSFAAQSRTNRGDTQQLLHAHAGQAAGFVNATCNAISGSTNFAVLVVSALVLSPVAALVVLCGLVVMLLVLRPLVRLSKRLGDRRAHEQRQMAAALSERLELNREIRTFGVEASADEQITTHIDSVAGVFQQLRLVSRMTSVAYRLGAFALILGMLAVIDASNATTLAALTGALLMLLRSLSYGQATQAAMQAMNEAAPAVGQLLSEAERFIHSTPAVGGRRPASARLETIELRGVHFQYEPEAYDGAAPNDAVLTNVDLKIHVGDFVAFVGPSGSGKSTLALLLGLRTPSSGAILVNGIPLADIDPVWWHARVAYVAQDPRLGSGTVLDAIRFGRTGVSADDAKRAAVRAHIAHEIEAWRLGWSTPVGQLGDQLSGGQRQRIAIARALAGEPDLLLLDEPTSALDSRSESLIGQTLRELHGEVTVVAIAHRLQTIEHADHVHRITAGCLGPATTDAVTDAIVDLDSQPHEPSTISTSSGAAT
jgi:ATP-binding cassette subfamily B protein